MDNVHVHAKEMDSHLTDPLQALLANKIEIFLAHCISVVSLWFLVAVLFCLGEQNTTLAGGGQVREMMAQVNLILGWWWVLMLLFCSLQ